MLEFCSANLYFKTMKSAVTLLSGILMLALPAFALDGQFGIHDPSTVTLCDGKYYTYGTGGNPLFLATMDGAGETNWIHWFQEDSIRIDPLTAIRNEAGDIAARCASLGRASIMWRRAPTAFIWAPRSQ